MKIEHGIEIPARTTTLKGQSKYPLADMKVGDSIFLPGNSGNTLGTAAAHYLRGGGRGKFTTRKVRGGYRCWRTK